MKKLMLVALVASLVAQVQVRADETSEKNSAAESSKTGEYALWPACFALCEWPETPDLVGIRLSIPFSTKQEGVTGIDLGLWGRCKDFEGLGLSILRNDVKDTFGGIQVGLYNSIGRGDLFCVQAGLWNEAFSFRGAQVGLVNLAGEGDGFQIGLINRAETLYGFQLGLVNVIRDAELPVFFGLNIGF